MPGRLINKTQGYTIVNGTISRDNRLGMKERGLILTLMSLPDNWEFSVLGLTKILPDGKAAIQSATQKLEEYGYIKRHQAKNENGTFAGYDWEIIPEPEENSPLTENQPTDEICPETPLTENQSTEKRSTENQSQLNNKKETIKTINNPSIYQKEVNEPAVAQQKSFDGLIDGTLIEKIKDQIEYDVLLQRNEVEEEDLNAVVEILAEISTVSKPQRIGENIYDAEHLKARASSITAEHVEYVFDCFYKNKNEVKNIKGYLKTSLINAPLTINAFYSNQVNSTQGR